MQFLTRSCDPSCQACKTQRFIIGAAAVLILTPFFASTSIIRTSSRVLFCRYFLPNSLSRCGLSYRCLLFQGRKLNPLLLLNVLRTKQKRQIQNQITREE